MKTIVTALLCLVGLAALAQPESVTKIAVIGCHNQHAPAPALTFMADSIAPDFCLWVGDNVYADTETDPQHIENQLNVLIGKPGFQELKQHSKFYVTWDDHDYGLNDAGKEYLYKEESKQIHRKFWELEEEIPADQDGVYYAHIEELPNGKIVQFIMIDCRSNRDNPRKRKADALGEAQWQWLEKQLQQEADLRFFVSGYQVLLRRVNRWEAWVKVGQSRKRLFELVEKTGAQNLLFVTGDQHYVEVLKSPRNVKYKSFEIMAAGINKTERPGIAGNRVAGPDVTIHSAPIIEIHWTNDPYVIFKNYDVVNNAVGLQYQFPLSSLKWK